MWNLILEKKRSLSTYFMNSKAHFFPNFNISEIKKYLKIDTEQVAVMP